MATLIPSHGAARFDARGELRLAERLYPRHFIGERFEKILAKSGIPINVAKDHGNRIQTERDEVRSSPCTTPKGRSSPAWQSAAWAS